MRYFTRFEKILWIVSVFAIIISFIIFGGDSFLDMIASIIGVSALILCAKGNFIGIKGVGDGVAALAADQLNTLQRQCFLLPPAAVCGQMGAAVIAEVIERAGTNREGTLAGGGDRHDVGK